MHPGYGFLSENPEFAEACAAAGHRCSSARRPTIMRRLGNKVTARELARLRRRAGHARDAAAAAGRAAKPRASRAGVGYPVMLKASWGGGGRGMRVVEDASQLAELVATARREAKAAFGNDEVYLEKLVRRARHVEVQILGDTHGNLVHLLRARLHRAAAQPEGRRARAGRVPRRRASATSSANSALRIGRAVGYVNAGTVEFLQDADTGQFYFIEVNPRIQVEHTVTEVVTGIDIVKAQIRIAEGAAIGTPESGVPAQDEIRMIGPRDAVPRHDRGSGEQLHPGLRPHHRLPQPGRLRHPARRRHGLHRRLHHALVRFAAGEGDGVGADAGRDHRAHAPRAAGSSACAAW